MEENWKNDCTSVVFVSLDYLVNMGKIIVLCKREIWSSWETAITIICEKVCNEKNSKHFISEYHLPGKTKLLIYFDPLKIQ